MQISVIIATWNRRDVLTTTLPPLLSQTLSREEYEVIVVVDGSEDGTAEWLRSLETDCNLRVLEQPNRGQAAAINAGLRIARGRLVLFLDDDILCGPNLLEHHVSAQREGRRCLAFGPVLLAPQCRDELARDSTALYCDGFFKALTPEREAEGWFGCMASPNSSAPREVLLEVGGLDEEFTRGNDWEFGYRLLRAGYSFVYCPGAVTHQIYKKNRRDILEDAAGDGACEIQLCRKHPSARSITQIAANNKNRSFSRRLAKRVVGQLPFSVEPLLRPFTSLFYGLRAIPGFRRAALKTFRLQQAIATHRGAVQAAGGWQKCRVEFGLVRLPILMYHHIGPKIAGTFPELTISPRQFRAHLRWLKRHGYQTISCSDWIAACESGAPLPAKPVMLTFDDGYEDWATHCFPALEEFGFTGTFLITTDYVGSTNVWDQLDGSAPHKLLSAEQIQHWSKRGMEFGSHSRVHPDLRKLSSEELERELGQSRSNLEAITGAPALAFAYPFGYYGDREADAARRHYRLCFTCDEGRNERDTDPARLRRTTMYPGGTIMFLTCLLLGFDPLRRLRMKVQLRTRLRRMWRRVAQK